MASRLCAIRRRVVACIAAYVLELGKLGLLVVGKMGEMPRGILHRLNSGQVRHGGLCTIQAAKA